MTSLVPVAGVAATRVRENYVRTAVVSVAFSVNESIAGAILQSIPELATWCSRSAVLPVKKCVWAREAVDLVRFSAGYALSCAGVESGSPRVAARSSVVVVEFCDAT